MKKNDLHKEAIQLEQKLAKFKLHSDMIPSNTWYINLRNTMKKEKWHELRKAIFKSQQYRCGFCGGIGMLHCHEVWNYDYKKEIQQLEHLRGICQLCHSIVHLGYTELKSIPKGKYTEQQLMEHWSHVNDYHKRYYFKQRTWAYRLWEIRSSFSWTVLDSNRIILGKI